MKTSFISSITAVAAVAAFGLFSAPAMAEPLYPQFTVDQSSNGIQLGTLQAKTVVANKIVGSYQEVIDFGAGTFQASLLYEAGQFVDVGGTNPTTNIGNYGLYGLYNASGTFSIVGGKTVFTFVPSEFDSFSLYLDRYVLTRFSVPESGAKPFGRTDFEDDVLLATGKPISGTGSIDCFTKNLCGAFGATTSFELTDAGKAFFVAPRPFYDMSIQTGQLNGFTPSGRVFVDGSLDTIFAVPEPTSVALLGLGFLGVALSRRRNRKA